MRIAGIIEDKEEAKMIERIIKVSITAQRFGSLSSNELEKEDREINEIIDAEINRLKNRKGL